MLQEHFILVYTEEIFLTPVLICGTVASFLHVNNFILIDETDFMKRVRMLCTRNIADISIWYTISVAVFLNVLNNSEK